LDRICGANHDLFSHTRAPRRRLPMDIIVREEENINLLEGKSSRKKKMGIALEKEVTLKSKILIHFIKGKISLTPMEVILIILENWNIWRAWSSWLGDKKMRIRSLH
jgi:hypothetical protein